MSDPPDSDPPDSDPPPPPRILPRRPPRHLAVHWLVDSAVTFCVVVLPALFLGAQLIPIVVASLVVGALLAPWTRRREIAALARRPDPDQTG